MVTRIAFLLCFVTGIAASPVWACGILQKANPLVGSHVHAPVKAITLTFSEAVVPVESDVTVTRADGQVIPNGTLSSHEGASMLALAFPIGLPFGHYKVQWHALWKDCDSKTQGSYGFTIDPPGDSY